METAQLSTEQNIVQDRNKEVEKVEFWLEVVTAYTVV